MAYITYNYNDFEKAEIADAVKVIRRGVAKLPTYDKRFYNAMHNWKRGLITADEMIYSIARLLVKDEKSATEAR